MSALVQSGRIVDLILLLVAVEAAALMALKARLGRGPSTTSLITHLAAGAFLLLALRAALSGADWRWIAAALLASFAAHTVDQLRLWRSATARG